MKKITFLATCFLANITIAQDEVFPTAAALWNVRASTIDEVSGSTIGASYAFYDIEMLDEPFTEDGITWKPIQNIGDPEVKGKIREVGGIVYFTPYADNYPEFSETVANETIELYNFNLEEGDTAYFEGGMPVIVETVGTSTILYEEKTAFYLSNEDVWVVGMGSEQGLFRPILHPFEYSYATCFYNGIFEDASGEPIYALSFEDDRNCTLNIQKENKDVVINAYPNPANQVLHIDYQGSDQIGHITTITGKQVAQLNLVNGNNSIDISSLAPGMYFIRIDQTVQQLIVQ